MVEGSVYFAVKLLSIICYDRLRYPESVYNILPHKLGDIIVFDGSEGFSFYPYAKVVCGNQQQLFFELRR